jgi:hypothetical protein
MNATELKKELENATVEYRAVEADYRQHVLKYGISLMAAELAVVGFLLQNTTTQRIMSHFLAKSLLVASLLASLLSVVLNVLSKRIEVDAEKNLMHSYQYRVFARSEEININISGIELPTSMKEGAEKEANESLRKFMMTTNKLKPVLDWSEYALLSGLLFSVFFVIYLITGF